MGRIVLYVLVIFAAGYILTALSQYDRAFITESERVTIEATSTAPLVPVSGAFMETGTLIFYPNNVGPVPYLMYQGENGRIASKALTFADAPPAGFWSWVGARVSVGGRIEAEHVVVTRIDYIAPP